MELVLKGLLWERCLCYIDDIIIFGAIFDQAFENSKLVFDRFRQANFKFNSSTCHIFQHEVSFLFHVVSDKGIKCDPKKIKAVFNWPVPSNASDVRSFLGLAGYYRGFIGKCSEVVSPLTQLTKKNKNLNGMKIVKLLLRN